MIQVGYTRSEYDSCIHFRVLGDMLYIYLLFHGDDVLIATKSLIEVNKFKSQLSME